VRYSAAEKEFGIRGRTVDCHTDAQLDHRSP